LTLKEELTGILGAEYVSDAPELLAGYAADMSLEPPCSPRLRKRYTDYSPLPGPISWQLKLYRQRRYPGQVKPPIAFDRNINTSKGI